MVSSTCRLHNQKQHILILNHFEAIGNSRNPFDNLKVIMLRSGSITPRALNSRLLKLLGATLTCIV